MANLLKGLKPVIPIRTVYPSGSQKRLRCKCGNMTFSVLVSPVPPENQIARAVELICDRCLRTNRLLEDATIARTGKLDVLSKKHAHYAQQGKKLDADDA